MRVREGRWRKSTRSASESEACVELSGDGRVRDSKNPAETLDARGLLALALDEGRR